MIKNKEAQKIQNMKKNDRDKKINKIKVQRKQKIK